ncbi:MAG: phenylalanine--tRNA ligase subunit alpha [Candidatus Hydrogenedentes bacterium]|nr:phenylalanine--tRNA ligase subunit alpha [Candidatus Hydrogenedentota bacterium]
MNEKLECIRAEAVRQIELAPNVRALEETRVRFLGRKGALTEVLRSLGTLCEEERRSIGKSANELKAQITVALDQRKTLLETGEAEARALEHPLDLTLPGRRPAIGRLHPLTRVAEEVIGIFRELGFQVASGPEVETEYYNFDSLNTPDDHPARDQQDTFFVRPGIVLRTQTSPVQVRVMEKTQPPVAIIAPGRVYRHDADASHSPMFFQIEGLLVDHGVSLADLKGTLLLFVHRFFGRETKFRFRPGFFPFTEPSAEVDISCSVCKGTGCRVCKNSGWVEILGCGMVHPEVFRSVGYDYEQYTGYAFGLGIDRITMLRHSISSIHYLYENDLRFLEQF